jgi:hypothetical protein
MADSPQTSEELPIAGKWWRDELKGCESTQVLEPSRRNKEIWEKQVISPIPLTTKRSLLEDLNLTRTTETKRPFPFSLRIPTVTLGPLLLGLITLVILSLRTKSFDLPQPLSKVISHG